jgi:hypothetical protein
MKIPALHGIILVHGSQKEARNIEKAIYKSHKNINYVESTKNKTLEPLDMHKGKTDLADQEGIKTTPLNKQCQTERSLLEPTYPKRKSQSSWRL